MAENLIKRLFERAEKLGLTEDLSSLSGLDKARITEISATESCTACEFDSLCRAIAIDSSAMYQGLENKPNRNLNRFIKALSPE